MAAGELASRLAVAAVGIPVAIFLLYLGGWPFGLVLAIVAAIGAAEAFDLGSARGYVAFRPLGAAASAAFVAFSTAHGTLAATSPYLWATTVATALVAAIAALWLRGVEREPLGAVASTLFGAVFVGGSFSFAVFLRNLDPAAGASWTGAAFVAYPLTVTWIGDTAAYFCGKRWGRHRLSPRISPKKSVEGAIAGLAGSVISGALFGWLVFDAWLGLPFGALTGMLGGALIAPAAQVGDLAESLLKRSAGVKDSGSLLPGHGGVLDRFDAVFYAFPVAYLFLTVLVPMWAAVSWR